MQEGVYPKKKKKKSVASQFAAVKYQDPELNREDYGVYKYWGTSCCCKRVNNENNKHGCVHLNNLAG